MFCWLTRCGVASPPADCFTGVVLCQHGPNECIGNTIEACAIALAEPLVAHRFIYCFEVPVHQLPAVSLMICTLTSIVTQTSMLNIVPHAP